MAKDNRDPRVPDRDESVLRYVLEGHARTRPDAIFLKLPGGEAVGYADFKAQVERTAAGLAKFGVRQGDMVASWLPNGLTGVRVWFAINWLGAIYVPINTAYRGNLLAHVLNNCGAKLLIAHGDLVERLDEVDVPALEKVVTVGGAGNIKRDDLHMCDIAQLDAPPETMPALDKPIEPWDVQSIIYTSGTTGPSKGVVSSYAHLAAMGGRDALPMFGDRENMLVPGPLFHASGTMPIYGMLLRGATAIVLPAFSTASFWDTIRATGATATILLGVMASFLLKEPRSSADRDHPLETVILVPLPEESLEFAERFGVTAYTCFNMSETAIPILSGPNPTVVGTCGVPRAGIEARIVDTHDREVAVGQAGELLLRADAPWSMGSGYFGNAEASLAAWRNGWFHTGDMFRRDEAGNFFFVDRLKDSIRRRGENISSFEVESEILMFPGVRECAVVAVPSENTEDEVLAVIAASERVTLDPAALHEFLAGRLAHFMLPRFIRVMADLPRTPTEKVQKDVLRSEGVTVDCWDREVAGIKVRRTVIAS